MGRRRKSKLYRLFIAIVVFIAIFLIYYKKNILVEETTNTNKETNIKENKNTKPETKVESKTNTTTNSNNNTNTNTKTETNKTNNVTEKSSNNENTETKNEQTRRGGSVKLELIGSEQVTISLGSKYKDQGVKATYSDGSDASNEVDVENAVDTSKKGTYTVSYYAGNAVVIRRVTVE